MDGKLEYFGQRSWCTPNSRGGPLKDSVTTDPSKKYVDRTDMPQASEAELIVDATLSQYGNYDRVKYPLGNFAEVTAGGMPGSGSPDSSNHLISDAKAAGGNIGFADNHLEWRPFNDMRLRHITSGNNASGDPHWWW